MQRITLILLLVLLVPDIYLYLTYIVKRTHHIMWRSFYWLPSIAITMLYLYLVYMTGDNALSHHPEAIGKLSIAVMLLAVPKLILIGCSLLGVASRGIGRLLSYLILRTPFLNPQPPFNVHRTLFTVTGIIIGTISAACILYGAIDGVSRFEVKEVTFQSDDLPKGFDGYRIVQLSDIHIGSWHDKPHKIQELVQRVNALKPDLIVFTGDLINQQSHELDGFQQILSQLHATDGVYSVLGNHDYGSYYHWKNPHEEAACLEYLKEQQHQMGWTLLDNAHVILHHRGDSIALIGVENDGEPPFPQHADLDLAQQGTEGLFCILLSHNPTHWRREVLPQTDIQLTLAGHTHAMQTELLGYSLSALKYPEWSGMYHEGKQALYVNIGIGYVGLPFRFGAWPEITVLTLQE